MSHMTLFIDGEQLKLDDLARVARGLPDSDSWPQVALAPQSLDRLRLSRGLVDRIVAEERPVYGITTGFGKFSEIAISRHETEELQANLIMSHAAGVGPLLPRDAVRAAMLLRANTLAKGFSGVRPEVVDLLVAMLNRGVHPLIPSQGSLGASGDLAPLAHMALVLIGQGEAELAPGPGQAGERLPGLEALRRAGLAPLRLTAKEGLALINGTQVLTAVGALAVRDAQVLAQTADVVAALTMEALQAIGAALDPRLAAVRPHPGQAVTAANLRRLLEGSGNITRPGEERVQDAYSLRCIPQVHGASRDALEHVDAIVLREMNAATDNPLIFPPAGPDDVGGFPADESGSGPDAWAAWDADVVSGGNFHGQPVALAFDYLGIAAAEWASISERRTERLVNPHLSGLPAFLTRYGGLHSGLMILQYTAAALVSENKVLAHPASVDSIPTSAGQEDHVSMGAIAARKARRIVDNAVRVLGVELLCACQALDLAAPTGGAAALGRGTAAAYRRLRSEVPALDADRPQAPDMEAAARLVVGGDLLAAAEREVGPLS
ncbi:MAG: histidine ammonia-lyase [Bacillota bacterium]